MRARIAIPLFLVGIIAVLLPFVVRFKSPAANNQTGLPTIAANSSTPESGSVREPVPSSGSLSAPLEKNQPVSNPGVADNSAATENENYVANRIAELEDLAMTDEASSLATIESELDSREPRIQEAAVAATIQFGSRDAIPALRAAYERLDDPGQKVNLQKAIDFLELPTLSEIANATVPANDVGGKH